jgi:hypothetical protein
VAQELVEMSSKELDRLAVVRQVLEGRLTQAKAGEFVGLSERQVINRRACRTAAAWSAPQITSRG